MEENTQLPKEVVKEIHANADAYINSYPDEGTEWGAYISGATAYATQLHQANETIKVLEYDNNRLKGEIEGLQDAVEELQTKYDNILATESGHESKTENVWQSGYAAGHDAGCERGKREAKSGARWVKATSPYIKIGDYVAKFRPFGMHLKYDFLGMAFVSLEFIHFVCPGHYDLKWVKGHEELQYLQLLDESAAGREIDAVDLIEYIRNNYKPSKEVWQDKFGIALLSDEGVLSMYKQQK